MDQAPGQLVIDCIWDLRDDAYDHPDRWEGVTAVEVFQRLAELLAEADEQDGPIDWPAVSRRMVEWRAGKPDQPGGNQ